MPAWSVSGLKGTGFHKAQSVGGLFQDFRIVALSLGPTPLEKVVGNDHTRLPFLKRLRYTFGTTQLLKCHLGKVGR